jgi:hypothetical protein
MESNHHGKRHWLRRQSNTKPNWNSYSDSHGSANRDTFSFKPRFANTNTTTVYPHRYANFNSTADSDNHTYTTTNHTYSNAGYAHSNAGYTYSHTGYTYSDTGYTYSNAGYTHSDAAANSDPNPNADAKSNTCRAGPQPLDSDAGSDWQ